MMIYTSAKTTRALRDEIVADLRRRERMLRDSIKVQKTKSAKAACYIAAQALAVAAQDYERMEVI